jgi:hypothetical protein
LSAELSSTGPDSSPHDSELAHAPGEAIARLVREKKFCAAARLYSAETGSDLIESKLAIDRIAHRHGLAPITGCASYFALMVLVGGAAVSAVVVAARVWL